LFVILSWSLRPKDETSPIQNVKGVNVKISYSIFTTGPNQVSIWYRGKDPPTTQTMTVQEEDISRSSSPSTPTTIDIQNMGWSRGYDRVVHTYFRVDTAELNLGDIRLDIEDNTKPLNMEEIYRSIKLEVWYSLDEASDMSITDRMLVADVKFPETLPLTSSINTTKIQIYYYPLRLPQPEIKITGLKTFKDSLSLPTDNYRFIFKIYKSQSEIDGPTPAIHTSTINNLSYIVNDEYEILITFMKYGFYDMLFMNYNELKILISVQNKSNSTFPINNLDIIDLEPNSRKFPGFYGGLFSNSLENIVIDDQGHLRILLTDTIINNWVFYKDSFLVCGLYKNNNDTAEHFVVYDGEDFKDSIEGTLAEGYMQLDKDYIPTLTTNDILQLKFFIFDPDSSYTLDVDSLNNRINSVETTTETGGDPATVAMLENQKNYIDDVCIWKPDLAICQLQDSRLETYTQGTYTYTWTGNETVLQKGEELISGDDSNDKLENSCYTLWMQTDGNLKLYNRTSGALLWETGTTEGERLKITDGFANTTFGNLVVTKNGYANSYVWTSQTPNSTGEKLVLQDDGNLVLLSSNDSVVWQTDTSQGPNECTVIDENTQQMESEDGFSQIYTAYPLTGTNMWLINNAPLTLMQIRAISGLEAKLIVYLGYNPF
jgi:hypothetical protein